MSNMLRMSIEEFHKRQAKGKPRIKNVKRKLVNGIEFDSTKEARRYQDLELMQQAGQIFELRRQVPFPIAINGMTVCVWLADFVYRQAGQDVIEDVKGWKTDVYLLKKKLVQAQYGIKILET